MFFGHFVDYCYLMMRASQSPPWVVKRDDRSIGLGRGALCFGFTMNYKIQKGAVKKVPE